MVASEVLQSQNGSLKSDRINVAALGHHPIIPKTVNILCSVMG